MSQSRSPWPRALSAAPYTMVFAELFADPKHQSDIRYPVRDMLSRPARQIAACLAALGLLFSQVALAAYACPMEAAMPAEAVGDAECCQESAMATASLCSEHCKDSGAAIADAVPMPPDFVPAFTVRLEQPETAHSLHPYTPEILSRAASPPLSILNCCFRI
jgi:hypothetical protein